MLKKVSALVASKNSSELHLDMQYQSLLNEIKARLKNTISSVNRELIQFYWEIGSLILKRQRKYKWGDKLFDVLESDLQSAFPNTKGFSKTNLIFMRLFAKHYPRKEFVQALPEQLTWSHHVVPTLSS